MNKAELKAALTELGVEYPEDATNAELEALLNTATAITEAGAGDVPQDQVPEGAETTAEPAEPESTEAAQPAEQDAPATEDATNAELEAAPVLCHVLPGGPAGRIIVNGTAVGVREPGRIPRADFDRLKTQYRLEEIQE